MIGVDGGSTDPGPYYLGSGKCLNSRISMKRDLRLMLKAARAADIPLVVGSCGGAGASSHLDVVSGIVREIAREEGLSFRLAVIRSDQTQGGRASLEQGEAPQAAAQRSRTDRCGDRGQQPTSSA